MLRVVHENTNWSKDRGRGGEDEGEKHNHSGAQHKQFSGAEGIRGDAESRRVQAMSVLGDLAASSGGARSRCRQGLLVESSVSAAVATVEITGADTASECAAGANRRTRSLRSDGA